MGAIVGALQFVLGKIVAALAWFGDLFKAVFVAIWDVIQDAFCFIFDSALGLVITILGGFDFSGLAAYAGAWAGLPGGTVEVLSAVGVSTAVGIIISAIGIRLMMQLIPFVRLGS